jgi:two-component system, NarL family, response regulator LiaR
MPFAKNLPINETSRAPIKILIVEDDSEFLELFVQFIKTKNDLKYQGNYKSGTEFFTDLQNLDADVVMMDIQIPGKSGIECIQFAKSKFPAIQIIMLTSFCNEEYIFQALCAGANGYLLKSEKLDIIYESIIDVMNGGSPMSPPIARKVVDSFFKPSSSPSLPPGISVREKQIVEQLAIGLDYKQIANALYISPQTVRTHIRNVYEKLQVNSKIAAINKLLN